MQPPLTGNIYKIPLSTMWFGEDGIFYSITNKGVPLTKEALIESFEVIKKNKKTEKICWLGDVTSASPPTKEARDFAAEETPKFIKALVLITNSDLSKMVANFFLYLKKPSYPTKMFTDETEAKEWLKQYL